MRRKKPMRRMSPKRRIAQRERSIFVAAQLDARPTCEAGELLCAHLDGHECWRQSAHVHEPLSRGRGGRIDDVTNSVTVCASCHDAIHLHPDLSLRLGLLKSGVGRTAKETP